jgi:hypothetical protein
MKANKMKCLLSFILIYLTINSFCQEGSSLINNSLDTNEFVVLSIDTSSYWEKKFKGSKATILNEGEILELERLIEKSLDYYDSNKHSISFWDDTQDESEWAKNNKDSVVTSWGLVTNEKIIFNNYKRQYIPYINTEGEKEVWVNCFCTSNSSWKNKIFIGRDGGSCYFNLNVNLNRKKYYNLYVNGI